MTEQLKYPANYRRMERFSADVAASADSFPEYVFIEPSYFGSGQNDQHPPTDVMHGEALLASVYNGLRSNEALWQSTLLVVLHDEHGGFYDHVAPPGTIAPDKNTSTFAFDKLSVRIPALLISPWLDPGVLSAEFDHTSLLRYVSDKWVLAPLGNRAAKANSFASAFVRSSGRKDCPVALPIPTGLPVASNPSLNTHQAALAGFTHHLEVNFTKPGPAMVAAHSEAMASGYAAQSRAVTERAAQYLGATAMGAGKTP
jgi:phospholipase C